MKNNAYVEMYQVETQHWWYVGLHDLISVLTDKLFPVLPLDILDAGCGTGGLLKVLIEKGHNVTGFDYSEEAIYFCHQRGLENVFQADINEFLPNPNSYDLITAMDVLCHEWVSNEVKVLKSLSNGLKEHGLLMLNYPAFPILGRHHDRVVMIRKRYTKKMLTSILVQANLTAVLLSYRIPHAYLVLILLRALEAIFENKDQKSDIALIPSKHVNKLLSRIMYFENQIILRKMPIPFGSSLFAVVRKNI